ncbi:hypothetical protein BFW38_12175 [Terasakiispira papahanaumokuakeensis]|uniref:Flagellar hook-associated protein 2 n=1 Tax=Terasakiispira papahanaumokuakeensis TaxID=197479 RepID=A0A1E2VAY1_9GAMM|nr:flagellar filament capping protein FliD [Terasakiispira papahanaumokuakeensis]ODC04170.1 hypothetical protein BFW38_12175 [Terasakiispira papahanaumokuakeensis]
MSTVGNSAGIKFSGLGSGLDVEAIVDATVQAESMQLERLKEEKNFTDTQISDYGKVSTMLDQLQTTMDKLTGADNFALLKSSTSNENLFSIAADREDGAQSGTYDIQVIDEARQYKSVSQSAAKDDSFTGTLSIKNADGSDTLADIDLSGGKSLEQIRAAINANEDLKGKVTASIVQEGNGQQRLILKSAETGEENRLTVDYSGVSGAGLSEDSTLSSDASSLDAKIKVDGIEATSSTNTFDNVISGVTITLNDGASLQSDKQGTARVARDDEQIKSNIEDFVNSYNEVVKFLNQAKNKETSLGKETTIRSIETALRSVISAPAGSDPNNWENYLGSLGITTDPGAPGDTLDPNRGTLKLDSEELQKALESDFDQVAFVLGDPDTGYASRLAKIAEQMTSTTVDSEGRIQKGLIEIRTEGLTKNSTRIAERITKEQERLDALEARLYTKFNSIESLTANLNSTASYIGGQISSLPGYTR